MNISLSTAIRNAQYVVGSGDKARIESALRDLRAAVETASTTGGAGGIAEQLQTAQQLAGQLQREAQGLVKRVRDGMM